ncbi:MAG: flagellar biosynthesis protein FlhA [Pseudanabaenales cyanobacterium]|nr:flagellar biosynthesis protein FlhA [Pseudanabaenales cyanobacterium]
MTKTRSFCHVSPLSGQSSQTIVWLETTVHDPPELIANHLSKLIKRRGMLASEPPSSLINTWLLQKQEDHHLPGFVTFQNYLLL